MKSNLGHLQLLCATLLALLATSSLRFSLPLPSSPQAAHAMP